MRPAGLPLHTIHRVTGRDDRSAWGRAIVGVALLHPVGADERDAKIAIHVRSDDGLVVARNRPRERLLGIAVADEERPQARRPSCPSTVWVASMSRTRGGSAA